MQIYFYLTAELNSQSQKFLRIPQIRLCHVSVSFE